MKSSMRFLSTFLFAVGLILSSGSEAHAQVFVGAHLSVNDLEGATWGVGARAGAVLHRGVDFSIALEGVGEYLWPPCESFECDALAFQGNFLARRRVVSTAEAYLGLGLMYQNYTLEKDETQTDGDDFGLNIIVGTQAGQASGVRPFLEVRFTIMDELENQFGAAFGLRVPVN